MTHTHTYKHFETMEAPLWNKGASKIKSNFATIFKNTHSLCRIEVTTVQLTNTDIYSVSKKIISNLRLTKKAQRLIPRFEMLNKFWVGMSTRGRRYNGRIERILNNWLARFCFHWFLWLYKTFLYQGTLISMQNIKIQLLYKISLC